MLKLHDSLTREVLPFPPENRPEGPVSIYACGPTVYHYAHIGNLRTFAVTDLLRRYLEYRGHEVKLVMNITDVGHALEGESDAGEDKIESAARKEKKTPEALSRFYEEAFFRDLDALNVRRAATYPRATEHIQEMIALVQKLLDNGKAYATEKGDVYYDVSSFEEYGKLSGNTVEALVSGARVEAAEDKRDPADFALWISNPKHVMQWEAPWGRGYPGWHLECSAMAMKYLGDTFDLHIGGEDLKFPHHECEIAQSEGATGKPFARRWLHVKYLMVEGQKMSKSLGNFYTLSDLLDKGHSAAAVRHLLLSAHYRTPLNFTFDGLAAADEAVRKFWELKARLGRSSTGSAGSLQASSDRNTYSPSAVEGYRQKFEEAMDDDLNVSAALAVLHDFMRDANRKLDDGSLSAEEAEASSSFLSAAAGDVFGLKLERPEAEIPRDVRELAVRREEARKKKDWAEADRLRAAIERAGFAVEDAPEGPILKKRRQ
jgi:cysteinyl-tRNA synthetase